MITLAPLPYDFADLEPVIDKETVEIHYIKHHQGYVNKLNELIAETEFKDRALEEIIKAADWPIFNNSAQIRNHTFYLNNLQSPRENNAARNELWDAIMNKRWTRETFVEAMTASAVGNFGSWWTWLVKNPDGTLDIMNTSNAGCPLTTNKIPLITIDVWEHAYYLQYQNRRIEYVTNIWKCINREKALERYNQKI